MKLEMNDMQLLLVLLILPIAAFAVTANNAYGLTGWASMLELALAITNKHPNKSEFSSFENSLCRLELRALNGSMTMRYLIAMAIAAIISGSAFGGNLVRGVDAAKLMHSCSAFSVKRNGADAYGARFDLLDGGICVGMGQIGVDKVPVNENLFYSVDGFYVDGEE